MITININWKVRFKNKAFLIPFVALVVSFLYEFLTLLGVTPTVEKDVATELTAVLLNFLGIIGVIVDPTTKGFGDKGSDEAEKATYYNNEI